MKNESPISLFVASEKSLNSNGISHLGVVNRWPASPRQARVVRASASGAVDLGLIPSRAKPMTLKLVFTAYLLDTQ